MKAHDGPPKFKRSLTNVVACNSVYLVQQTGIDPTANYKNSSCRVTIKNVRMTLDVFGRRDRSSDAGL